MITTSANRKHSKGGTVANAIHAAVLLFGPSMGPGKFRTVSMSLTGRFRAASFRDPKLSFKILAVSDDISISKPFNCLCSLQS
jgi:hypothetical protein